MVIMQKKDEKKTLSPEDASRRRFYALLTTALLLVNGFFLLNILSQSPQLSEEEVAGYAKANEAVAAFDTGNFREAITLYSEALEILPDDSDLFYNRALAYLRLNMNDAAVSDLQRAITISVQEASPYLVLGDLYDETGETQLALEYYRQYIALAGNGTPDSPRVTIRIAELEQQLNGE